MKKLLTDLPPLKQNELKKVAQAICKNCDDVEKIILYGSYARGTYKEEQDLAANRKSGHASDYDILVVTAKKETALDSMLWAKIYEICVDMNLTASTRILRHDIETLNIKLSEAQYFFSDIVKEGIILFDSGKFEFAAARNLTAKEKQKIAQQHFDEWFIAAKRFYRYFQVGIEENDYKRAAFFLNQAAESAYKAVLLVFSNYSPDEHFLKILGAEAEKYSALLQNIFSKLHKKDEELFDLLDYAYIGGRYDPKYKISKEDLTILAENIKKLLEITEEICKKKIAGFN